MGKAPAEHYWSIHQHKYPYQIVVPYMSQHDIDPRMVQKQVSFHFLRVPFDHKAHWGFMHQHHLDAFKKLADLE